MRKHYVVNTQFGTYEVYFVVSKYFCNDNLCLELFEVESGPFARMTVNLDEKLDGNMAYIDTNNCKWATDFIERYSLGKDTGKRRESGWCTYPLYEIDLDKIKEGL